MCGIAGIVNLEAGVEPPDIDALGAMAAAITHRGPDEFGVYRDENAGFSHARLSIIDIVSGQQPLSNENGRLWIVFNGEIFNYVELRGELQRAGHIFKTQSDTEVIVHAYEEWGYRAFERFNGQWAIALWDRNAKSLVLSRDPFGIHPLYYCRHGGRLFFASEVKSIFSADASIPREFDPVGLDETFTFWSVVSPQGVFAGVNEVKPGHIKVFENGGEKEFSYWAPQFPVDKEDGFAGSLDEATEALTAALDEATRLRVVRADVPVGSYLSGGIDSSFTAALGRKAKEGVFKTFSVRFDDAEYDETEYQREMVNFLESDHEEIVVSREEIADSFSDVVYHTERPVLRTAAAPLYLLSKKVRSSGIKVVLTGEGADELLGGYDIFREAKVRRFWGRFPESEIRPRLLERLYPYLARSPVSQRGMARGFFGRNLENWSNPGFSHEPRWNTTHGISRFYSDGLKSNINANGVDVTARLLDDLPHEFGKWSFLAQDQYLEIRTLLSGYLLSSQGDRMLMANSVEGRFPFLDINVANLANSLPHSYKLHVLDEKHVLKRASKDVVPSRILERKKQPYRAPDALCFASANLSKFELINDLMGSDAVADAGVFNPRAVSQLWKKCLNYSPEKQFSNFDNMAVIGLVSTQLLYHHFMKGSVKETANVEWRTKHDFVSMQ